MIPTHVGILGLGVRLDELVANGARDTGVIVALCLLSDEIEQLVSAGGDGTASETFVTGGRSPTK